MTPRYIDANKLDTRERGNNSQRTMWREIKDLVDSAPTEDVVKVVHGCWKWERKIEPQAQNRLYCSVCDNECLSKDNYYVKSDWCPHCGAKMDAKEPNND